MSLSENMFVCGESRIYYSVEKTFYQGEVCLRAVIECCEGNEGVITIPEWVSYEERIVPVRVIGKKAFLGNSNIVEVILPKTVTIIDNWAFAQCDNLRKITILRENYCDDSGLKFDCISMGDLSFGKGVFSDSSNLMHICIGGDKECSLSALLGTIFNLLDAEYLLKDSDIGKKEWFIKWDSELLRYLSQDDEEGANNQMLGGEEDINKNTYSYILEKKKNKASLCFTRLMNKDHLSSDVEETLSNYLKNHTKGSFYEASWQLIVENHSDQLPYYEVLYSVGGITLENLDSMLQDLGQHHLEAKAYLISLRTGKALQGDFSDDIFCEYIL